MKNSITQLLASLLFLIVIQNQPASAQQYVKDGGATNNSTFCLGATTSCKKVQLLYLPTNFIPAPPSGSITTIYFMYGSTGIAPDYTITNLTIKMGQTTNTGFVPATDFYTGLTTVLNEATYTIPAGVQGGWFPITLTTPFPYDNTQTLIVETTLDAGSVTTFGLFCGTTIAGQKLYSASTTATTGTVNSNLQNFGMNISTAACSGQPAGGSASAAQNSICASNFTTVTVSGQTTDLDITLQWKQSSVSGGPYSNVTGGSGATTATYTTPPLSATTYYVCEVTCLNSGLSSLSTEAVVNVNNPQVASTTPGTRCGAGTVTLGATAGGGANTLNWYLAPSGGTPLGTGTSFTTPVITQTTDFYVGASVGAASNDSLAIPLASGNTTGIYHHMFLVTATNDLNVTGLAIKVNAAIGALTNWDLYYRPDNFTQVPGANTSSAGWTLITNATNVVSLGPTDYTFIALGLSINIPNGATYSFYVAPADANSTHQYLTSAANTVIASNLSLSIKGGFRGTGLFNCVTSGGCPTAKVLYTTGCEGVRVPVTATVTPSDPVTINAGANALCLGQSTTLTAVSNNSNYTFTWSPSTGLSGTTGSTVTAQPVTTVTYQVYADDGTCGALDTITISVGPTSVAGTIGITADTICANTTTTLSLTGTVGSVQWQSNTGSGWVNETGPGSNSTSYVVSPLVFTEYRAVVTSGGCAPDTSGTVNVEVLTVADPVVQDDSICGPGVANLGATGTGTMYWYTSQTGGTPVASGNTYNPNVSATTTFYVEALSGGGTYNIGAPNTSIGNQLVNASNNWGLAFDVLNQATIEKVTIEPAQTGNVTLNLRALQNGPILNTTTVAVTAFSITTINLGWIVNPGTGYRLELAQGSVQCYYNSTGAVYPYTTAGSPVTITGYCNPNFNNTGTLYLYFYNWEISQGCRSNRVPVTATVLAVPPTPTISQNGSQLTSSSPVNNQWYLNGNPIPGATGQIHNVTQAGSYTVVVTDPVTGCSSESQPVIMVGITENNASAGISISPNPATHYVTVSMLNQKELIQKIVLKDVTGRLVKEFSIISPSLTHFLAMPEASGIYMMEVFTNKSVYTGKVIKQ
ncbi:MAG: T9SS type A sorting domain-containing protein [Bacteroidia bacterium]|nr:T9SS type A sorting domain-containing protein [Bacteroidia bacterium]